MTQHDLFQPNSIRSEIRRYDPIRTQGAEANHKGRELEKQVRDLFVTRGAVVVPYHKYSKRTDDFFNARMLVPQFPYRAVMGRDARADLVYFHDASMPGVGIECKVQDDSGSADEKLFTMYHNSLRWPFADHAWFVLSGNGFRKHFVNWLQNVAAIEYPGKTVRVFTSIDGLRAAVKYLVERGNPMGGG